MDSSEHVFVGNSIQLTAADGNRGPAAKMALDLASGALSYGYIVALGGDFYGTSDLTPISSSANPGAAFQDAFGTLNNADATEKSEIVSIIDEEIAAAAAAIALHQQPSVGILGLGDGLSVKWNAATYHKLIPPLLPGIAGLLAEYGRYMNLAQSNLDHFGDDAWKAYTAGHTVALQAAVKLHGQPPTAPATLKGLRVCYAMNAFADHFLTDLFAGGHLRTPRRELSVIATTTLSETGFLCKAMHDEDNEQGVLCVNRQNSTDTWVAYGDAYVRDTANTANLARATTAVQQSADEVYDAFTNGWFDQTHAAMLSLVPLVGGLSGPGAPQAGPLNRTAPMFYIDSYRRVYRRNSLSDPADFGYTAPGWSVIAAVAEVVAHKYLGLSSTSPPAPT